MAVCLDYQSVYTRRREIKISMRLQLVAGLLLLAVLCCKVWVKVASTDVGYQLARLRQQAVSLDMERRELELQLSVLLRTDNLARMARDRLHLAPLDPRQARRIDY